MIKWQTGNRVTDSSPAELATTRANFVNCYNAIPFLSRPSSSCELLMLITADESTLIIMFVSWLLNVPATCECISGTDLLRQVYVLPH